MGHAMNPTTEERRAFDGNRRVIEGVCLLAFLPIAAVARLDGWRWQPWPPGPEGYGSVLSEARAMASTVAGIVCSH